MQNAEDLICPDPTDDLPDGAIIEGEVRVVSYMDSEGDEMWAFAVTPGFKVSQALGLIEMVKTLLAHNLLHAQEDDEDDE